MGHSSSERLRAIRVAAIRVAAILMTSSERLRAPAHSGDVLCRAPPLGCVTRPWWEELDTSSIGRCLPLGLGEQAVEQGHMLHEQV